MNKDEAKKLIKIELDGIANTQSEYDDGWWETSTGAEFGKERLQKVLKIVEALEQPAQDFFERGKEIAKWADKQNEQPATTYKQPHGWMQQLVSETDGKKTIRYTFTKTRIGKNDIPIYFEEALEQPAQEPVALIFPENRWYIPSPLDKDEKQIEFNRGFAQGFNDCILHVKLHNQKPLYTHPAPSWQGLSNDRIREIGDNCLENNNGLFNWIDFARAIEQALKEKNHG